MNNPHALFAGVLVYSLFAAFLTLEFLTGVYQRTKRPARDVAFTVVGLVAQTTLAGGLIGSLAGWSIAHLFPAHAGALANIPFWIFFPLLFVTVEFMHYIIHRLAHEWRPLWKIHRTHHSATDMSVGIVFRYNIFWTLLLPQTWATTFCIYLGQGPAAVAAVLTTFTVNLLTHMNFRWDLWLRQRFPATARFWAVLEHIITLPDTHHAHHGLGKYANVQGNYAITLFLFDTMLGTAKIPHAVQEKIGMANSEKLDWKEELFWPLVRKEKAKPGIS